MAHTLFDVDPRATAAQVGRARLGLLELARRHGLAELRVTSGGALVVHVVDDPGYRPVIRFVVEATSLLGAEPDVIVDDAPAARELSAKPL